MSYQPFNSIPVTPISMLDRSVPIFEEKEEEFVEGFSAPKVYKNERMPMGSVYQRDAQPQPAATPTPPPSPPPVPDSSRDVLCELKNIKYLLAIIALLMFLLLLFRR